MRALDTSLPEAEAIGESPPAAVAGFDYQLGPKAVLLLFAAILERA
jgi:hypothetical protein